MRRVFVVALSLAVLPGLSHAGGFELIEQSPQGIATVGAQGAVAEDSAAVFYNPAGMTFQPGFGALVGGQLAYIDTTVNASGQVVNPKRTAVAPTLFITQRLGRHFAVGIGSYSNFAEHFKYPDDWSGRFLGRFVDVTTATINPVVAFRPIPQLSFAGGLMIIPGSLDIYQAINFGGGEGGAHAGLTAVAVGGNAGLLVEIAKQYLRFGFTYRSRADLHFSGVAAIDAPPEVQGQVAGLFDATTTLPLPHNFTFALSSRPTDRVTLSVDAHYTLWKDISTLTLTQISQQSGMMIENAVALDLRNSWGVRGGFEYRVLDRRLRFRAGLGWDQTPLPRETLGPLIPDTDRILVGAGIGYHDRWFSVQAGYLAAILLEETSANPDLRATYSTVGHVVSAAATLRFSNLGGPRLSANEGPWSDGAPPPKPEKRYGRR